MELLDPRVGLGLPELNEAAAVELLANTANKCVESELENRPTVNDVVVNLQEALSACDLDVNVEYSEEEHLSAISSTYMLINSSVIFFIKMLFTIY